MRNATLTAAVLVSALALALWFWRLSPLLPERGGTTCFAADYNPPLPVDLSSPRRDERSIGEVSSMRLEVYFPPDEKPFRNSQGAGYDWRYSLRLKAEMTDGNRLSTAAICEAGDSFIDRIMPALSCYIDCDGGSVTVWRKFGQSALSTRFEAGERLNGRKLQRGRRGVYRGGTGGKEFSGGMGGGGAVQVMSGPRRCFGTSAITVTRHNALYQNRRE